MPSTLISLWPELALATTAAKDESMLASGEEMKFKLIGQMHAPKSGRVYGSHQASAPGEAPATETGALESSIVVDKVDAITVMVGTDNPHAIVLEFGGGRIAPRPNFQPVGEEMAPDVTQKLITALRTATESTSIK